jgi:transposase-like protein
MAKGIDGVSSFFRKSWFNHSVEVNQTAIKQGKEIMSQQIGRFIAGCPKCKHERFLRSTTEYKRGDNVGIKCPKCDVDYLTVVEQLRENDSAFDRLNKATKID